MKSFTEINGRLISVTTSFEYPPIPFRGNDYCAYYTNDQSDNPNCGWGRTAEDAISDLVDSYDPEEAK